MAREDILALRDVELKEVFVPEWKESVWVRGFTGEEQDLYSEELEKKSKSGEAILKGLAVWVIVHTVCDKEGNNLFTDADIPALNKKQAKVIRRLAVAALEISGLTESSKESAEKN